MDLRITHCLATNTDKGISITVFFSKPVDVPDPTHPTLLPPTFAVFDPPQEPFTGPGTIDAAGLSATFIPSPPISLKVDDKILVSVTGIKVGKEDQGSLVIGAVV